MQVPANPELNDLGESDMGPDAESHSPGQAIPSFYPSGDKMLGILAQSSGTTAGPTQATGSL